MFFVRRRTPNFSLLIGRRFGRRELIRSTGARPGVRSNFGLALGAHRDGVASASPCSAQWGIPVAQVDARSAAKTRLRVELREVARKERVDQGVGAPPVYDEMERRCPSRRKPTATTHTRRLARQRTAATSARPTDERTRRSPLPLGRPGAPKRVTVRRYERLFTRGDMRRVNDEVLLFRCCGLPLRLVIEMSLRFRSDVRRCWPQRG